MKQAAATTLDMVRHGEIATADLLCADRQEPLSDKGRAQLERLKLKLGWDLIISSPSARCSDFAEDLASHLTLPLDLNPSWQEIDFGAWTGITRQSIWEKDKERLLQLWSSPLEFCAPEGESMADFVRRIQSAFAQLLHKHHGKHILLLTHAGVIRAILASALDIDYRNTQKFNVEYAKINRLRAYPDGEFSLLNWNCSAEDLA
jgi:alpha-ribazole phosphatase